MTLPPVGTAARSQPIESSVLRLGSRCHENQAGDLISAAKDRTPSAGGLALPPAHCAMGLRPVARISVSFAAPRPCGPDRPGPVRCGGRLRDHKHLRRYKSQSHKNHLLTMDEHRAPACLLFRRLCRKPPPPLPRRLRPAARIRVRRLLRRGWGSHLPAQHQSR